MNNIYLLTLNIRYDIIYGSYDSHVVIAPTEHEARKMCPFGDEEDVWNDTKQTTCNKIGESEKETQLVLSSYNAG